MNRLFLIYLLLALTIFATQVESAIKPNEANKTYVSRPTAAPKINTDDIDLGPYIRKLQQAIKYNWNPTENNAQKRVVTSCVIAKNGNLLNYFVKESSGDKLLDKTAINAIKKSAPFSPLPSNLKEDSIEIQFTFSYNVLGASRIK